MTADTIDIAHLRTWIGRTEEADDIVTPRLTAEFRATFDPQLAPTAHDEAPLMIHWCLTPRIAPTYDLAADGHPTKGDFLPPVPLPRRMWAGGLTELRAPLRVGDTVRRVTHIEDVAMKEGRTGRLCFVTLRHEYSAGDQLAIVERQDIVYREAAAPGAPASTAAPKPSGPKPDLVWTVDATPALLFRYSALTFNSHRIHYDLPYVTQTEGYVGLLVHGPVQGTLLAHIAATALGRTPASFSHRGLTPLVAGTAFQVFARREDDVLRCWTQNAAGAVCMEGEARP